MADPKNQEPKDPDLFSSREDLPAPSGAEIELISIPDQTRDLDAAVAAVEKNIELFKKIKAVSLKLTSPKDWIIQRSGKGESLFLQEKGAENVALAWGIDVTGLNLVCEWHEDDNGKYYIWKAFGKAYSKKLNRWIEDMGICSQRDKFFGKIGDQWKPIEDIDVANIQRKAITNLYGRLIKRMVGIMNVQPEDLFALGFKREDLTVIEYGEGSKKADQNLPEAAKILREKARRILIILGENDPAKMAKRLHEITSFEVEENGKKKEKFAEKIEDLRTERWIAATYGKLRDLLKKEDPEAYEKIAAEEAAKK